MFSGFTYTKENVAKCTEWKRIRLFLMHLRYVWCDDDLEFLYIIRWMAIIFQYPWVKPNTCIVNCGPPGHGKGMVWEVLGKLIGACYAHATSMEDVVGKYLLQYQAHEHLPTFHSSRQLQLPPV
jgi:hypothetical protein